MRYNGIFLNIDALVDLAFKLGKKIEEISDCYDSVKTLERQIDGNNDNWKGDDQKEYYNTIQLVTGSYHYNVDKLIEIYDFLLKIIDDYETKDESFGKDTDRNADNFDV